MGQAADRPRDLPSRYRIGEVIGTGGMGSVYRAHDTILGRDVAIKVIDTELAGDRFVREARAAARLAHPNIVAVHDVDPDAGWLVMDLIDGRSLRDLVQAGPTPASIARRYAAQVLSALDAAHTNGVIHRDIKPSNIIVDDDGKITVVDFGVARLVDAELTKTGESLGTPAYMAPEQLRGGSVDARTDLYGLGATLYELVSAERMVAFESPSAAAIGRVVAACKDEPGLAYVIEKCLQADPADRLQSARDALAALGRQRPRPTRWIVAGALAALAVIVSLVAIFATRPSAAASDARRGQIFVLFQRGEHAKAGLMLQQYLADHPTDPEARLYKLLADWWVTGLLDDTTAATAHLSPVHRDMVHGIALFVRRQENEAIAFLEAAERRYPNSVEIVYALGEARWHGQQLERGAATLERAFQLDPRWQVALHHVVELRQSRGEIAQLEPVVGKLRTVDRAAAAALECQLAIGRRNYEDAAKRAALSLEREEPIPALYVCLLQAQILSGDLTAAEATTKRALERWPIDLRTWGGHSIEAELLLYRGKLDEYLELPGVKETLQRLIALATWQPSPDLVGLVASSPDQTRGPPLMYATEVLISHSLGDDPAEVYEGAPERELRAYAKGLSLELRQDAAGAIAEYKKALAMSAKGDIRMLIAYQLARVLHAQGDIAGTIAACEEVVTPRLYQGYRAVLLPDCLLWSNNRNQWQWLADAWTGAFQHPAVVEARRQLAQ